MTTRSNQDDIIAIRDHFLTIWDDAAPVIFENETWTDEPKTTWARFTVNPSDQVLFSIGATLGFRQSGFAWLMIMVPDAGDIETARSLEDRFIKAFRHWHSPDGVVRFKAPSSNASDREPGYYIISVSIKYESDH